MDSKYVPKLGDYLYLNRLSLPNDRTYYQVIDVQDSSIAVQDCTILNKDKDKVIIQHDNKGGITILY